MILGMAISALFKGWMIDDADVDDFLLSGHIHTPRMTVFAMQKY